MRLASNVEQFIAAPEGSYLVGDKFAAWIPHRDLRGISSWRSHDQADISVLSRVLDAVTAPTLGSCRFVLDQEFLTTTNPTTYYMVAAYIAQRRERLTRAIDRLAVVRTPGFTGTLVVNLISMFGIDQRVRVFEQLRPGLDWLGEDASRAWVEVIETARHEGRSDDVVSRLRTLLEECVDSITADQAARRLGVSRRTLQRRLSQANTTFQAEVDASKLERAKSLMLASDLNLSAVAFEAGFASPQHFSTSFRRLHGEPPMEWRRKRRSALLTSDVEETLAHSR